jgi:hypothetical protein
MGMYNVLIDRLGHPASGRRKGTGFSISHLPLMIIIRGMMEVSYIECGKNARCFWGEKK